ncbi:MAG: ABC transporter permease [Lachnospiraceae bacterium]|nr:ABC transporter permease [Lachnospiraceae bacterium]
MRFSDMLRMSVSSLFKRKVRTIMTITGVMIGTASIIVMVSLGIGLQRQTIASAEQFGSLTAITVSPGGTDSYGGSQDVETLLSDKTVQALSGLEHVDSVDPVIEYQVILKQGIYEGYFRIRGMTEAALENMNVELSSGRMPKSGGDVELLFGNGVIADFQNPKAPNSGYWSTGILPEVDYSLPMFIIYDTDAYQQSSAQSQDKGVNSQGSDGSVGASGSSGNTRKAKKYITTATGVIAGNVDDYSQYSWYIYTEIDSLVNRLKTVFRKDPIPGQPKRKNGKAYPDIYYSEINVSVDSMENVNAVMEDIKAMGYRAYSNSEWIQSELEQANQIQVMLGGIGGVSLLVAAIGIANTMMMSIYERTKEIGVYKVLGCALKNIRSLFLLEAAFIGFFGGIVGIGLSYLVSFLVNRFTEGMTGDYAGVSTGGISYIPPWLTLVGVAFATVVGIVSGFFPALRAMRLSPLAAIRNE